MEKLLLFTLVSLHLEVTHNMLISILLPILPYNPKDKKDKVHHIDLINCKNIGSYC